MSYQGFNYSTYQYPGADTQNGSSSSCPSMRTVPATSSTSSSLGLQQQPDRECVQQDHEWSAQPLANLQTQAAQPVEHGSWPPSTHAQTESYGYHQQQQQSSYRGAQSAQPILNQHTLTQGHLESSGLRHDSYTHTVGVESTPMNHSDSRSNTPQTTSYNSRSQSDTQNRISAMTYQPNGLGQNPADRPPSAQSLSRNAAATTMTALSTTVPPGRSSSQSHNSRNAAYSQSSGYNTTAVSNVDTTSHTAPYSQQTTNPHSRSSKPPSDPHPHRTGSSRYSTSMDERRMPGTHGSTSETGTSYSATPVSQHTMPSRHTSSKNNPMPSRQSASAASTSQWHNPPQRPPSVPGHLQKTISSGAPSPKTSADSPDQQHAALGFIDPSELYNPPYRMERGRNEADEAAAIKARAEAEAEAQRQRQEQEEAAETKRKEEEEAGRRKKEANNHDQFQRKLEVERRRKFSAAEANAAQRRKTTSATELSSSQPNNSPTSASPAKSQQASPGAKRKNPPKRKSRQRKSMPAASAKATGRDEQPVDLTNDPPQQAGGEDDEEDIASEIKKMMEKMQKWKSKDPNLVAKLLVDLGGQPSDKNNSPQSTPKRGKPPAAVAATDPSTASTDSPAHTCGKPTGDESDKVGDSSPVMDMGKFPYHRRRRMPKGGKGAPASTADDAASHLFSRQRIAGLDISPHVIERTPSTPQPPALSPSPEPSPPPTGPTTDAEAGEKPAEATGERTIWPDSKKITLAQVAASYIRSVNEDKECPPNFISELIAKNPSYIELCQMLESQGFTLSRVHFAKHLLTAVPDLSRASNSNRPPSKAPSVPPHTPVTALVPSQGPPPAQTPAEATAAEPTDHPPAKAHVSPYTSMSTQPNLPPPATHSLVPPSPLKLAPPPPAQVNTPASAPQSRQSEPSQSPVSLSPAGPPPQAFPRPPPTNFYDPSTVPPTNRVSGFVEKATVPPPASLPPNIIPGFGQAPNQFRGFVTMQGPPPATSPQPPGIIDQRRSSGVKLDPRLRVPAPPAPKPAPGSKEARARKRTFAEIVDLTQPLSDEEDEPPLPPAKEPRLADVPAGDTEGPVGPVEEPQVSAAADKVPTPPETSSTPRPLDLSQFRAPDTAAVSQNESIRRNTNLIKPLNRAEALRKSYYDPKTIARDILIAAGRHPTERALNQHLVKLRGNFIAVDNSSDLHTFRWDIVDPGGPPPPEVPLAPVVCRPPKIPLGVRRYTLPNQYARDSTSHASDSSQPQPALTHTPLSQQSHHTPSQLRTTQNVDELSPHSARLDDEAISSTPTTAPRRGPGRPPVNRPEGMPSTLGAVPRRGPGRPPGSGSGPRSEAKPSTSGRPGRPRGAKNKSSFLRNVEIAIPASAPTTSFRVFKCRWQDCDAQLHNLETLRKHVFRLHVPEGATSIACHWGKCPFGNMSSSSLIGHLDTVHVGAVAWKMGEGPSLAVSSDQRRYTDEMLALCLNDTQGRTVTPKATTSGNPPTLILPAAYSSIKSFYKIHGNDNDRSKALEVMKALEAKQMKVGNGLGRGGCTLMNPARLDTVAAFERVFKVVSDEEIDDAETMDADV
ncbi:hypothetical protein AJ80_05165 [Polytolypa hystricis UAMH7299]|uniref:C2H2-type domain-containing protein n=1 Tax=Polytolypa hystricis (strain UAMH7299) TaxID=1447883 RepID=A0A2B7Y5H6_POLH7|nr:hypothetical protein AJ80_05165 [Polytolypa hystricis UAMH7299]